MKLKPLLLLILFCIPISFEVASRAEDTHVESKETPDNSISSSKNEIKRLKEEIFKEYNSKNYEKGTKKALLLLKIVESEFTENHKEISEALHQVVFLYNKQRLFNQAESYLLRAIDIDKKIYGENSYIAISNYKNLATLHMRQNKYNPAKEITLKTVVIQEKILGKNHIDLSISFNRLGKINHRLFDYDQAEYFYLKSLEIKEKNLIATDNQIITILNNLGNLYIDQNLFEKGEKTLMKALKLSNENNNEEEVLTYIINRSLGRLYYNEGLGDDSIKYYKNALNIIEKSNDIDDIEKSKTLNDLSTIYMDKRQLNKALELAMRALKIKQEVLGEKNRSTELTIFRIGNIYDLQGSIDKAEFFYQKSLDINRKLLESREFYTYIDLDRSLRALADIYTRKGQYIKSEELIKEGQSLVKEAVGENHKFLANSHHDLARLYNTQGLNKKAIDQYKIALDIKEKELGETHPDLAILLNGLANLYSKIGLYKKSQLLYERSLNIDKNSKDNNHPDFGTLHNNIANTYLRQGLFEKAAFHNELSSRIALNYIQREAPFLPKFDRIDFKETASSSLRLALTYLNKNKAGDNLAMFNRLNFHGLLERIERLQSKFEKSQASQTNLLKNLRKITQEISSIKTSDDERNYLRKERARLQTKLYNLLPELNLKTIELTQVAELIPKNGLLIEYQTYFKIDERWGSTNQFFKDEPNLVALLLYPNNDVIAIDLGLVTPIEEKIQLALEATETASSDQQQLWDEVSQLVIEPLAKQLEGKEQIFISPDAELNRVPFAALKSPTTNQFLGEAKKIRLLTTGRELLDLANNSSKNNQKPLVIANPSFDLDSAPVPISTPETSSDSQDRSGDLLSRTWKALPGTAIEGKTIAQITDANLLTQTQATALAIQEANTPKIFHIASHAYYLPPEEKEIENPLLRSGIVLAGANNPEDNQQDDGYLTALEVTKLDLKGTQMVVISGCESGKGDIQSGEGVYGLKRAIAVAGARSSLLSLWKVDDAATAAFMESFYQRLKDGQGRADALLEIQKDFREKKITSGDPVKDWSEPYYWAAFQLSGDWTPIEGL